MLIQIQFLLPSDFCVYFHALVIDRGVYVETATKSIRVQQIPRIEHWFE